MNQELIVNNLHKWMLEFVEVPNAKLGGWPPCPYARQARLTNSIEILFSEVDSFDENIKIAIEKLEKVEVVIICFDHNNIDPLSLQEYVTSLNASLTNNNYVVLEDHPGSPEYINGVKMNFEHCGLLIIQKLDKLNAASDQLKSKGYYDVWSQSDLDSVVSWRYK